MDIAFIIDEETVYNRGLTMNDLETERDPDRRTFVYRDNTQSARESSSKRVRGDVTLRDKERAACGVIQCCRAEMGSVRFETMPRCSEADTVQ